MVNLKLGLTIISILFLIILSPITSSNDWEGLTYVINRQPINIFTGDIFNSTEEIQDASWDVLTGTQTRITVVYDDANNVTTFVVDDMTGTWNITYDTVSVNDPSDWDAIGDVPTATPSDGDTTHLSLADEIYDWVMGLGFLTNSYNESYDSQLGHNTTSEIFDAVDNETWVRKINSSLNTVLVNDPSDWDAIGDVPTATPSDGDTTHLSLADEIYDWVIDLGYLDVSNAAYGNENNLIGYWAFENSNIAYDSSGHGNDGTVSGATWTTGGKYGGAYNFDTTDNITLSGFPNATNTMTVSLWAKNNLLANDKAMIAKWGAVAGNRGWVLVTYSTNAIRFNIYNDTGSIISANTQSTVNDNEWHYLVGVANGTHLISYDDGVPGTPTAYTGLIRNSPDLLTIGYYADSMTKAYNGTIDEIKIYNTSLSADEIKAEYLYGITNHPSGEFLKRSGGTVDGDIAGNDNDLTGWKDINGTDGYFTGNITGNVVYAEAWYHNHTATALNFAVDGTYYNLSFSDYKLNGFASGTNTLIAGVDGRYSVNWMAIGDGINNHKYVCTVLIDDVVQNNTESHKKLATGGDILTMQGTGFIDLTVGNIITLACADDGDTGEGNYYGSNLNLVRIGD